MVPACLKKFQAENLVWSELLVLPGIYKIFAEGKPFTRRCHRIYTEKFLRDMGSQLKKRKNTYPSKKSHHDYELAEVWNCRIRLFNMITYSKITMFKELKKLKENKILLKWTRQMWKTKTILRIDMA